MTQFVFLFSVSKQISGMSLKSSLQLLSQQKKPKEGEIAKGKLTSQHVFDENRCLWFV